MTSKFDLSRGFILRNKCKPNTYFDRADNSQ